MTADAGMVAKEAHKGNRRKRAFSFHCVSSYLHLHSPLLFLLLSSLIGNPLLPPSLPLVSSSSLSFSSSSPHEAHICGHLAQETCPQTHFKSGLATSCQSTRAYPLTATVFSSSSSSSSFSTLNNPLYINHQTSGLLFSSGNCHCRDSSTQDNPQDSRHKVTRAEKGRIRQ